LVQFTSDFSQDVSEYRSLIEAAAARAQALTGDTKGSNGTSALLLAQIIQANEHLRCRLDEAESSLQCRSAELESYMTEARTDALTGLSNRRAFDDELTRRMAAFRRHAAPLGLLLVDVDRFKSVNDRYGHHIGDQVLKAVADSLRQAVREEDQLSRYGGEEFAILLGATGSEEFRSAAERVRRHVEHTPIRCDGVELNTTISCGVAEAATEEDVAALLRRADEALYASKSGGRNCAHWHDGRRSVRITPAEPGATVAESSATAESFRDVCAELRRKLLELTN
jgi:diguanylate cyclase